MRVWEIDTPKPPDDVWSIVVDFSERLDRTRRERLTGVEVEVFRLQSYDEILATIPLTGAMRLNLEVEEIGGKIRRFSWPVLGQPNVELRLPKIYPAERVSAMVPVESIIIGPTSGEAPYTCVSFRLHNGEHNNRYAIRVTAITNLLQQHSCVIRFRVAEISLSE